MKHFFVLFFIFFTFAASAQHAFSNKKGHYKISVPDKWTIEHEGDITSAYAPDEEEMDTWKEKLEISVTAANDLTLEEAMTFYVQEDLPTVYNGFKILKQGEETVNGLAAKWVLFSFTGSGTVGTGEVSFTMYNLFYLVQMNNKLFMLNGIAEQTYYPKLESDYLKIARSFQVLK